MNENLNLKTSLLEGWFFYRIDQRGDGGLIEGTVQSLQLDFTRQFTAFMSFLPTFCTKSLLNAF